MGQRHVFYSSMTDLFAVIQILPTLEQRMNPIAKELSRVTGCEREEQGNKVQAAKGALKEISC